jgi:signal peptidase II
VSSQRGRAWARMLIVCGLVVVVDQASKGVIIETMVLGERTDLALGVDLVRVTNSGIAFGLLDEGSDGLVLAVTSVSLVLILGWFAVDTTRPGFWLGVGLLTGGALGNLADRIRSGAVTDFFDPPLWPAFNIADVAITVGVIVVAVAALAAPAPAQAAEP